MNLKLLWKIKPIHKEKQNKQREKWSVPTLNNEACLVQYSPKDLPVSVSVVFKRVSFLAEEVARFLETLIFHVSLVLPRWPTSRINYILAFDSAKPCYETHDPKFLPYCTTPAQGGDTQPRGSGVPPCLGDTAGFLSSSDPDFFICLQDNIYLLIQLPSLFIALWLSLIICWKLGLLVPLLNIILSPCRLFETYSWTPSALYHVSNGPLYS